MARRTRHRVGIRIELPTRCVRKLDLDAEYKKRFKRAEHFELCLDTGITPEIKAGVILARAKGCEPKTATFSVLVSLDSKQSVMRIVQILNVLGDNRVMREKLSVYMTSKSVLNHIPELMGLQLILENLSQLIPGLADNAWVHAPEATL